MKHFLAPLVALLLVSCSKEETPSFWGIYRGDIEVFHNQVRQSVMSNHEIQVAHAADPGQITLSNNVMISSTAQLSGWTLRIPKTLVGSGPGLEIWEEGSGSFEENRLQLDFYQERIVNGNRQVTRWAGSLHRK